MKPVERVAAAFEHRPSDRVPIYQAGFSSRAGSIVLGREAYVGGGIQQYREARALWQGPDAHAEFLARSRRDAWDIARTLDLDLIRPSYWRMNERPTRRIDEHIFFYGDEDRAWRVMRFDPDLELYQVVDRHAPETLSEAALERSVEESEQGLEAFRPTPEDYPDLSAALAAFDGERAVPGYGTALGVPREPAWLEAIVTRPDLVRRNLAAQAAYAEQAVPVMAAMGLRHLMGGGDFASKNGPFYSPRAFHNLMLPALRRISEACHAVGAHHLFASDGDLWLVADDLFGASGMDGYYEIDRRAGIDLDRLRTRFPHLTLLGGISSETLHLGSREEVVRETRSALAVARERGSIIVGCSNQIVAPTPPDNLWAMMETLHAER